MRIVSLLPSATEICFALGLGDQVVGVTHECDYPPEALTKPVVTAAPMREGLSSRQIDEMVRGEIEEIGSIYSLDAQKLEELKPDLILTQRLCTVCAVSIDQVREVAATLSSQPAVMSLEPSTVAEVFLSFYRVAQACGVFDESLPIIAAWQARYRAVRRLTKQFSAQRVMVLEWIDPPFACGHWIPRMVEVAGGTNVLGNYRYPSKEVTWDTVRDARASILILAACGFSVARQKQELEIIVRQLGLHGLARESIAAPKLFICDGAHYFSRPGPRLVDTTELLAMLIHPELEAEYGSKFKSGLDYEHIEYGSTTYERYWQPQ